VLDLTQNSYPHLFFEFSQSNFEDMRNISCLLSSKFFQWIGLTIRDQNEIWL